jgi:hypothetical protein
MQALGIEDSIDFSPLRQVIIATTPTWTGFTSEPPDHVFS